jgi:hypothetical protein
MNPQEHSVEIPLDFDAITTLVDLQTALDKERTTSVLTSIAMGFDAVKSFLLMGASINKVATGGRAAADLFDDARERV